MMRLARFALSLVALLSIAVAGFPSSYPRWSHPVVFGLIALGLAEGVFNFYRWRNAEAREERKYLEDKRVADQLAKRREKHAANTATASPVTGRLYTTADVDEMLRQNPERGR